MHLLFSDFDPTPKQAWEKQLAQELKGKPLDSLRWTLPEGFSLDPYYTADDLTSAPLGVPASSQGDARPGEARPGEARQWTNMQLLLVKDVAQANAQALEALNGGATGLYFDLTPHARVADMPAFVNRLLQGVLLEHCAVAFRVQEFGAELIEAYLQLVMAQGLAPGQLQGFLVQDPLGRLPELGLMDNDNMASLERAVLATRRYPHFKGLMLDSRIFHNSGASASQELACLLSLTVEYLHRLTDRGISPQEAFESLGYSVSLGSRYFVEIAKLRALRLLVGQIAGAYGVEGFRPEQLFVHAQTGRWSKSRLDSNTNLLRNTTEAMSGILGGCNALSIVPHDALLKQPDAFSLRMARNVSTILQEEAYLGKVQDPVAGAYYPEILTQKLVQESWRLFLELEKEGGYAKVVESGSLHDRINAIRIQRLEAISTRRQRVVGVNAYSNPAEALCLPQAEAPGKVTKRLLRQQGQADAIEDLRCRTEGFRQREGRLPLAVLLQWGDPLLRSARASFATDFLGIAGIQSMPILFNRQQEAVALRLGELQPDIVVLCAADDDYNQQAISIADSVRQQFGGVLLVAGNPELLAPDVKQAALDGFIHLKSNAVALLTEVQDQIFASHEA
ncbi:methylmalonyl-CoA mutase family protein [Cesiribacter andamanensis]|uniref:Methylmalonyl-CoA mutase small subunit n=1 Tax=Cesiribacter andamanensis AMV16 TaxID=1279009 RepID=M7N290_9BACT|nr:methylmalonyl-CoA mutase family protein [Cesiribacter andamanensis]EMR01321.1 Methylmalonyl-CoA mutase small subunit [Cesiribacter andamanensis AMV16]